MTEAEAGTAVTCAQDMMYTKNILESLELSVELPMVLEIDNRGAVDLLNSWAVGGRTRHVGDEAKLSTGIERTRDHGLPVGIW